MRDLRLVEYSDSLYATPMIAVQKKKRNRLCSDFRMINKVTIFEAEPMRKPNAIMLNIVNNNDFTKINLSKDYWQIPLSERSKNIPTPQTYKGLLWFLTNAGRARNRKRTFQPNDEDFIHELAGCRRIHRRHSHSYSWEYHQVIELEEEHQQPLRSNAVTSLRYVLF